MVDPKKCLIVRFSSIGDIILSSPLIEYLKKHTTSCKIDFMTLTKYSPILEGNPGINRIIEVKNNHSKNYLSLLAQVIKRQGYDLLIDVHNSLRSKYIRFKTNSQNWLTYRKPRLKRFSLFNMHADFFDNKFKLGNEYIKLLDKEVDGNSFNSKIYLSEIEKKRCRKLLDSYGIPNQFVAFVPGASWKNKIWPTQNYIELINQLSHSGNLGIVLLGGSGDGICDEISVQFPGLFNLMGKTELRTSFAVLSLAQLAVGSDTGLIHGAEAVGTPVVMICGPTSHQTGASIQGLNSITVESDVWCRPCSKNGSSPCYRSEQFCMTEITPTIMLNSIQGILSAARDETFLAAFLQYSYSSRTFCFMFYFFPNYP